MRFYKLFLFLFSRPGLFKFWFFLRKVSTHALNLSAAARLPCEETGELAALRYALSNPPEGRSLVIFDVGANIGPYASMCLAELKERTAEFDIYSFEPTSTASKILTERFQSVPQVHVLKLGLSNEHGEQSLFLPWETCPGASSHAKASELWPEGSPQELIEEKAQFDTLDALLDKYQIAEIHLLKIDVEGTEFRVIEGARRAINAGKIKFIQFEISIGTLLEKASLLDFWNKLSSKYRIFLIMNQGLIEIETYDPMLENFAGASNFLCQLRA